MLTHGPGNHLWFLQNYQHQEAAVISEGVNENADFDNELLNSLDVNNFEQTNGDFLDDRSTGQIWD